MADAAWSILGTVEQYEKDVRNWYLGFVAPAAELVFADGARFRESTSFHA